MNIGDSSERSQDFDINLAPIIDCFTVLITFMLASASFLAIGIFDSSVAAPGPASTNAAPPSISIEIVLNTTKEIEFKVTGKTKIDKKLTAQAGDFNTTQLIAELESMKKSFPDTHSITISAADDIEYLNIVRMMEVLKSHIETTLLGGF